MSYPLSSVCCYAQHAHEKVAWQITDRCHLRCSYCFTPNLGRVDLSEKDARSVVDRIRTLLPWKRRLLFAGREPLLYPHFFEVAKHAREGGLLCSLSTSGELLTQDKVDALARVQIYKVNVTINAADAGMHRERRVGASLPRVVAGLKATAERGIVTKVNITATPEAVAALPATLHMIALLPVSCMTIGLLHAPRPESVESREYLNRIIIDAIAEFNSSIPVTIIAPPITKRCADDERCPVRAGLVSVLPDGTFTGCNIYPHAFEGSHDSRIMDGNTRRDRRAPAGL